jgi:hypothetical protein
LGRWGKIGEKRREKKKNNLQNNSIFYKKFRNTSSYIISFVTPKLLIEFVNTILLSQFETFEKIVKT